jgi:hypothetical protein
MPVHVFKHSSRSLMMLRQRVGLLLILCLALLLTPLHATERTASHLASSLQSLSTSRQGIWSRVFGSENQTLTSQQATQLGQAWENAPLHVFRDSAGIPNQIWFHLIVYLILNRVVTSHQVISMLLCTVWFWIPSGTLHRLHSLLHLQCNKVSSC